VIETKELRARGSSRGQALVEFAFVLPIFLLLLFGTIDFGRYVYYVQILNNAAREGARYAIVHGSNSFQPAGPNPNDPAVAAVVQNYAVGVIGSGATFQCGIDVGDSAQSTEQRPRTEGPCRGDVRLPWVATGRPAAADHDHWGVDPCHQQLTLR